MSEAVVDLGFPDPYSIPLEDIHVGDPMLFKADAFWPYLPKPVGTAALFFCFLFGLEMSPSLY